MPVPVAEPAAAAAIFARVEAAPAGAAEAERRILPCLVTEAAMDAAKAAVEAEPAIAPRRRGRPPKQRAADDLAPVAPRKRGRPRKVPIEAAEPKPAAPPRP
ncbi:MAG: OmpA family protein, partial [Rhodoblastus sp.]